MDYKPCKDCKDRRADPNCHIDCERYLEYRKYIEDKHDKVWKGKNKDLIWWSSSVKERNRLRKERENAERYK